MSEREHPMAVKVRLGGYTEMVRKLLRKATRGWWRATPERGADPEGTQVITIDDTDDLMPAEGLTLDDARLVCTLVNDAPAVLDELDALRARATLAEHFRDSLRVALEQTMADRDEYARRAMQAVVENDALRQAFGDAWATAERYRLALYSMRHEAEIARAHRMRRPGGMQAGTPRWVAVPLSILLDIIRTVEHTEGAP